MIEVTFFYRPDHTFSGFRAQGHAGYAPVGETDEVCAGITALCTGTMGALQEVVKIPIDYRTEEGDLYCKVEMDPLPRRKQEDTDLLLQSLNLACRQIMLVYGREYVIVRLQPENKEV